jgi:FPC/CPF motif-containing protein YcgG
MIYTIKDLLIEARSVELALTDTEADYKDWAAEKFEAMEDYLRNKLDDLPSKPSKDQLLEKGCLIGALRIIGSHDAYSCPRSALAWLGSL